MVASRGNNFGFLRLLFASLVVVSHSPQLVDGNDSREILVWLFGSRPLGHFAVDGFFLVSGYLITQSCQNSRSIGDYLTKRIVRIYPGFIVAFLASTLVVAPCVGGDLAQVSALASAKKIVLLDSPAVPGTFAGLPSHILNGSMWTIPYEFRCYLLVIVLCYAATRVNRGVYAFFLFVLTLFYAFRGDLPSLRYGYTVFGIPADTARLTTVFFVGAAFYVWRDRIVFTHRRAICAAAALIALMIVPWLAEPAFAILGGYLIFWYAMACAPNRVSRMMDHADPSYGLYLYAWPVQGFLVFNISGISPWAVTVITLPVGMALGLLSWHLIEKPALRHKHLLAGVR
ncbi:acyltransferase family protein [Methylobacterium sp. P31]